METSITSRCRRFHLAPIIVGWISILSLNSGGCSRSTAQPSDGEAGRPKNFILISIDTLRADHLSCYGYERQTSPRLDSYARKGALFLNVTSPSAWTAPSHLSIFTGLEPIAHQIVDFPTKKNRLNPKHPTMAKIFSDHGYRTAAYSGGGPMGPETGCDIGFENFTVQPATQARHFSHNRKEVDAWLDEVGDQKFFLCYHGFDVHRPYRAPPKYQKRFAQGFEGYEGAKGRAIIKNFDPGKPKPSEQDLQYVISQYDAEIAYVDDYLCNFLDSLERRGLLKNTLVLITSDHGDEFYEHGSLDHIHTLYDELVRVPWLMFGPGVPPVEVRDHVGTLDILPTVLDLFGIKVDAKFQGVSRVGSLIASDGPFKDTPIFSFTGFSDFPYHISSVRTNRWKLKIFELAGMKNVVWGEKRNNRDMMYTYKFKDRTEDFVELFDLQADPAEQKDVSSEHPEIVAELKALLDQRVAESKKLQLGIGPALDMSEDQRELYKKQLEALGYVGGADDENDSAEKADEADADE